MQQQLLPFTPQQILAVVHRLECSALLYQGDREDQPGFAVLGVLPTKSITVRDIGGWQNLCEQIRTTPTLSNAENLPEVFCKGWLGYISYDGAAKSIAYQSSQTLGEVESVRTIWAEFCYFPASVHMNFATQQAVLWFDESLCEQTLQQWQQVLAQRIATSDAPDVRVRTWQCLWNEQRYQLAFEKVQQYLRAGDCYQVNLAVPFVCQDDLRQQSPFPLLQSFAPSFGGYWRSQEGCLTSVSPERFIRINGQQIETKPIKGTVARGDTPEQDAHNKQWLANSSKNRAENLMIVDLLRNDLSKQAKPFSVKVDALFAIESHANVHHMVSTIHAEKLTHVHPLDVVLAALPGGSITGAPKQRAMEVIAELEARTRGPYCGVMGYFDDRGLADFNILIRTLIAKESEACCWAGGGVVMDSTCEEEWQEIHTKVSKILNTSI